MELILSDNDIKQDYENLQTIPGIIASISSIAIIAEVPSIVILPNARALTAYAGLITSIEFQDHQSRVKPEFQNRFRKFT